MAVVAGCDAYPKGTRGIPQRRIAGLYKRGTTQQRTSHGQTEWTIYYSRVPKYNNAGC